MKPLKYMFITIAIFIFCSVLNAQKPRQYKVIAYYSADSASLHQFDYNKITHLIYSFAHLNNGSLSIGSLKDTAALHAVQQLKTKYRHLKTLIALGGWGGCKPCSETFNDPSLIQKFALSAKQFIQDFNLDGIDLDWEYPAIPGPPGHPYMPEDRKNFTDLVTALRKTLGKEKLVTFAAGGFQRFLDASVEWKKIAPQIDFVNLMSYDLVHGYSTFTGHHTPLYSAKNEDESVDKAIRFFKKIKFPLKKVIVGAAFYTRNFNVDSNTTNGLYQTGKFLNMISFKKNADSLNRQNGYAEFWDDKAKAPYWYNAEKRIFVTGDNKRSIQQKTKYIKQNKLGGIMFWELSYDKNTDGLLDAISF